MEIIIPKELDRLTSLEEAASDPSYLTPTKPLIQRVTQILRVNNDFEGYFQPVSVAFGPLHHPNDVDSRLHRAEKSKLQLAAKFIRYSGRTKEDFYNNVKKDLSSLKKCHEQKEQDKCKGKWDDKDLAWMFLVDGCEVLYLAYLDATQEWEKVGCKNIDLVAFAKLDIFLLENQPPFQLLQLLMSLCTGVPFRELDGNPEHYSDLQHRIQVHCNSLWASDWAQLYRTYFRTPWSFLVFLGAAAALVLTGLQTWKEFHENPAPTFMIYGHL